MTLLNEFQEQAVMSSARFILVLAGAGSGKTRVLVRRIVHLLMSGQATPYQILAVTFTNKAATQMRERLEQESLPGKIMTVGTFHGLAHRFLRQYGSVMGLTENFQIIDTDDQLRMIKKIMERLQIDDSVIEPKRALGFISKQKDDGHRPKMHAPTFDYETQVLMQIYKHYQDECDRLQLLDFAEILLRCVEMFEQHPEVVAIFHQRYKYLLVDEFQDTNVIQYRWLKLLTGNSTSMMVVGDDDQSIYGWRGAKIENIHRFQKDFAGSECIRLEQNYRSTRVILNAANALIANNEGRLGKELWTSEDGGEPIKLYRAFNEMDEAHFITESLCRQMKQGVRAVDIAILYRSNAQSRVIEQSLRSAGVPFRVYGGLRFFERAEIKDTLAYLRLISNPGDDPAFERIINVPVRGVGAKTVEGIRELAQSLQVPMLEASKVWASDKTVKAAISIREFVSHIEQVCESASTQSLTKTTADVLNVFGLMAQLETKVTEKSQARIDNLQELLVATEQYEQMNEASESSILTQFLSDVALDVGDESSEEDGVSLMTLHAAKGLEFKVVFLAGLEDGLFPHHRCLMDKPLLEEERRLCYVGITRAMEVLYMSYAQTRSFAAHRGNNLPSRFIDEIPSEFIESLNESQRPTLSYAQRQREEMVGGYKLGQPVRHKMFGEGVVLDAQGQGELARIQIKFARHGTKWLVLSHAPLESI